KPASLIRVRTLKGWCGATTICSNCRGSWSAIGTVTHLLAVSRNGPMPERPLSILQVSIADVLGGAEKMAWDLFQAYRERGCESWLAVGTKHTADADVLLLPKYLEGGWPQFWHGLRAGWRTRRLRFWESVFNRLQSWQNRNVPGVGRITPVI